MHEVEALIIYFSVFSFIGWICEVLYCSILSKRIVNRGFLAGPVCPVYGFGALFVEFTEYLKKNADMHQWFNESEFYKSFEKLKLIAEENKSELNHKLREKFEMLTARKGSGLRIIKAFPDMKSIKYDVQLNHLKEVLKEIKNKANIKK